MKPFRYFSVILAAVLALLAIVPSVSANSNSKFSYSLQGQSAFAYGYDFDGCIESGIYLFANDGTIKTSDGRTASSSVAVGIWQYDICNWTRRDAWGWAELPADAFTMDKLNQATLNTTVEVYDWYSGSYPVNLSVVWAGSGETSHSKSRSTWSSDTYKSTYKSDSTYRSAVVSGTATAPFGTLNFDWGNLEDVKFSSMSMEKLK